MVIVVEDNLKLNRFYCKALNHAGFQTLQATTVAQTLAQLEHTTPELIVLDMNLPDGDGLSVLDHLRHDVRFRNTRVIVVSGDGRFQESAAAEGISHYLFKPVSLPTLLQVVSQYQPA